MEMHLELLEEPFGLPKFLLTVGLFAVGERDSCTDEQRQRSSPVGSLIFESLRSMHRHPDEAFTIMFPGSFGGSGERGATAHILEYHPRELDAGDERGRYRAPARR